MAGDAAAPEDELTESIEDEQPESAEIDDASEAETEAEETEAEEPPVKRRMSKVRLAATAGLAMLVAVAGLTGWLGFRYYESHQSDEQRKLFLAVGKQGALNLTTIDWQQADADIQRILDSATGVFYDDFQRRSQPFIKVVKQAKSKSEGNITEAGLESVSGDQAQVLVAVKVKTSIDGAADQEPRSWRMRITVQKMGDDVKVSNVEFVP